MILLAGARVRSFSDRKRARSALFSSRAKKLHRDLGSGTEPSSVTPRMGAWPLVAQLMDVSLYLSNVTSTRSKSFPDTSTAFTNLAAKSSNVLHSEGLPRAITNA